MPSRIRLIARVRRRVFSILLAVWSCGLGWLTGVAWAGNDQADRHPNVVMIMTDNHGAWTLGCYGNQEIRTPHIDRLAAEGMLFERAFANNPVCSPTRATVLTGLMPSQHGVHCFLTGGRLQTGPDARCTLDALTSLPEVLKDAGYDCGLIGKWHLGGNLYPQEGFDARWLTMPHGGTSTFYDAKVIRDGKIETQSGYLTDYWTSQATKFIKERATADRPFFLFLSYNGPYALSRLMLREGRNRHAPIYASRRLDSFPHEPPHPWQYSNRDYQNNQLSHRRVATEVSGVDDGVGAVMKSLRDAGVDEQTVVIFLADQGWSGGHGGFYGMGDHTRPVTARDPMMQIPMIWRHPGKITAGVRRPHLVANYDLMPTLLGYLTLADQMPARPPTPGKDFTSLLVEGGGPAAGTYPQDDPVFYEFEGLRCIRTSRWKYVHRFPTGPHELFDLMADPKEENNLVDSVDRQGEVRQLKADLDQFFRTYSEPKFDLWNGGEAQTRLFSGSGLLAAESDAGEDRSAVQWRTKEDETTLPFELPDGFHAELVAGAPLVNHPTMACLDDRGRLFVCNNAGVNLDADQLQEQLPNEIRLLEDQDGDGRYDRSTVFADKMTFPMGGTWHGDSLYVASPPCIWKLQDIDNDGVADVRERLVSEFGFTGNAASIHGCFSGPDGRIYWCDGFHGHEFKDETGKVTSRRQGSYLFSCRLDGSDVRRHCGGGMDNPVEIDFMPSGDLIGSVNILYHRPRVDALVHWLYGGAYPHRTQVLQELKVTGDLLGPVHKFGHVAVSGMTRYRSGAFDRRWRNDFFCALFNSGDVTRVSLDADGATYRSQQQPFLIGRDDDFHPTDVLEDADGSLLVIDTGGWFYRGCPTSQFAKPEVQGAIYRIRRDGMAGLSDTRGVSIDWETLDETALVRLLNDTRHVVRGRAIKECVRRGAEILPRLERTLTADIRVRQNAVWALVRLLNTPIENHGAGPEENLSGQICDLLIRFLADPDAVVRQAACRGLADHPLPNHASSLATLLSDRSAGVRRQAAMALGRCGDSRAAEALVEALAGTKTTQDPSERHAIVYALLQLRPLDLLEQCLRHESPVVRQASLTILRQLDVRRVPFSRVIEGLTDHDQGVRDAALGTLASLAESGEANGGLKPGEQRELADWVSTTLQTSGEEGETDQVLVDVLSDHLDAPHVIEVLNELLSGPPSHRRLALRVIVRRRGGGVDDPVLMHRIAQAMGSDDLTERRLAVDAAGTLPGAVFASRLREICRDENCPDSTRIRAIAAMQRGEAKMPDAGFEILLRLLGPDSPVGSEAAELLASSRLTTSQLLALAPRLRSAGASDLKALIRPFSGRLPPELADAFLDVMEKASGFESLGVSEFSEVIKRYPSASLQRANQLLGRLKRREDRREATLGRLLARLKEGDSGRGKKLFHSEQSRCTVCHRVAGNGGQVGPDLSSIGSNRSAADLAESILFPSASIVRQYESINVLTTSGRSFVGVEARRTPEQLILMQASGKEATIELDEIERLQPASVSIMPSGLESSLGEGAIADLVAYLKTLRNASDQ